MLADGLVTAASPFNRLAESVRLLSLPMPSRVPDAAQTAVAMIWFEPGPEETADVTEALVSRGNDRARPEAERLVRALQALPEADSLLPPTVEAFNAFVDASAVDFLRDPAPEFLVLHTFLDELLESVGEEPFD